MFKIYQQADSLRQNLLKNKIKFEFKENFIELQFKENFIELQLQDYNIDIRLIYTTRAEFS